jgi:integrase
MQSMKLTKRSVDGLAPQAKPYVCYDSELPGFGIRVGSESKVFIVQKRVGSRVVKRTIGRYGIYAVDQARTEAKTILYELSQGRDPLEKKRIAQMRSNLTFGNLFELYLKERPLKPRTIKDCQARLPRLLSEWFPLPVNEVNREMVRRKFDELMTHPTQAAIVMRYARAVFNFGIEHYRNDETGESEIKQNPIEAVTRGKNKKLPKPQRRQGYLKDAQLPKWFAAVDRVRERHPVVADFLVVTLLLGARRSETEKLRWADVNLEEQWVVFPNPKNKNNHHIPLPRYVLEILKRRRELAPDGEEFVFPANSKAGHLTEPRSCMTAITAETGFEFQMHDLRRTFATFADALELQERTIKRLMNHIDDKKNVTLGYIINEVNRLRAPMQAIEDRIRSGVVAVASAALHGNSENSHV